ncbi:MAG: RrF2 family transcriptional regulator [Chloroflexota bacterium]
MRFTAREQYGLRAMVELARRYGDGPVPLSEVSEIQGLSQSYLEQVIAPLRQSGLLKSWRGASGGYALAHRPEAITVGDVIRVLDGDIVPMTCVTDDDSCTPPCAREGQCATRDIWLTVRAQLARTLDSTTLADLAKE